MVFQWLDYATRTTGRFTKSLRIMNLTGLGMSIMNRRDMRRDGDIMGLMEDCYPQSLESIKACFAPTFINVLWTFAKAILPKRVVEKFDIVNPI